MREIKFRIWDTVSKRMLFSRKLFSYEQEKREYIPFEIGIGFSNWEMADLSELMQWTGLTDRSGTDIYEGDIVKHVTHHFNGVVFFDRGCFWVRESLSHADAGLYRDVEKETRWSIDLEWEIVGNQYKNPELIHVKL